MQRILTLRRIGLIGFVLALAAWTPTTMRRSPRALAGWSLYDRYCLACHGVDGDGNGPAAPFTSPAPRDLTKGTFAWRSTPIGQPPTRDDLRTLLRHGAPGTSMPAFALSPVEIDRLVDVVQAFAPSAFGGPSTPLALSAPPQPNAARGAELWTEKGCASCHGPTGTGDSVVAKTMAQKPYDLTRALHRPRSRDDREARRTAAAISIATGLAGTAMPGYAGTITDAEIWALADHVVALRVGDSPRRDLDARAIERDRTDKIVTGSWPAADPIDGALFGGPIDPQGAPPPQLAPAQASLSSQQCTRCHAKQAREWQDSLHHGATSPGLAAQMWNLSPPQRASCLRCHAPLPEQATSATLHADAVGCASCHVRGWTRHGPEGVAPSLMRLPGYPLTTLAIYERADFCLPCHQLPPRTAVAGRPLLDTYREWLQGPYMRRGIQCQHCHMPNREHSFKGIHDPDTFRQGIALEAEARVKNGKVDVVAVLANVGAGHYLPTTPTPAAWLSIELLDAKQQPIAGARDRVRVGRHIEYGPKGWIEHADTRIPPGEKLTMARAWTGGRVGDARIARIVVEVHPDDYYEGLYEQRLAGKLPPERRALYEQALARGRKNHYIALVRDVPLSPSPAAVSSSKP